MIFDYRKFEKEAAIYCLQAEKPFTARKAAEYIARLIDADEKDKKRIESETSAFMEINPNLFQEKQKGTFLPRKNFFRDASFLVVPSPYEFKNEILFPGHRFEPFHSQKVFLSDINIRFGGKNVPKKELRAPFRDVIMYHSLLGMHEMSDYLVAESPENSSIIRSGDSNGKIVLTVFDIKKLLKDMKINPGDSLLFQVSDWTEGIFRCSKKKTVSKNEKRKKEWVAKLEKALIAVCSEYGGYFEIPEQIAQAFKKNRSLLESPSASLDEFIYMTEKIIITVQGGQTVLAVNKPDSNAENIKNSDVPDDIMISEAETNSLEEILKDTGCVFRPAEIEAFILDEFYNGGECFDDFFARRLSADVEFRDDAQEAVFLNYVEDLWETRTATYSATRDTLKAPIRNRIIEISEERARWFREMKELNSPELNLPENKIEALAEISLNLCGILTALNSPDYQPEENELTEISSAIEDTADLQCRTLDTVDGML